MSAKTTLCWSDAIISNSNTMSDETSPFSSILQQEHGQSKEGKDVLLAIALIAGVLTSLVLIEEGW